MVLRLYRQLGHTVQSIRNGLHGILQTFGIRFCTGMMLALLVLLAVWLPQNGSADYGSADLGAVAKLPSAGEPTLTLSAVPSAPGARSGADASMGHRRSESTPSHGEKETQALQPAIAASRSPANSEKSSSYLEFDPAVSQRLGRSSLTGHSLTGNRLTHAHFLVRNRS